MPALALQVGVVHDPIGDLLIGAERPALPQQTIHQRRLAVVHVRDDGHVPAKRVGDLLRLSVRRHPTSIACRCDRAFGPAMIYSCLCSNTPARSATRSSSCWSAAARPRRARRVTARSFSVVCQYLPRTPTVDRPRRQCPPLARAGRAAIRAARDPARLIDRDQGDHAGDGGDGERHFEPAPVAFRDWSSHFLTPCSCPPYAATLA